MATALSDREYVEDIYEMLVTVCVFDEGHLSNLYSVRLLTADEWITADILQDVLAIEADSDATKLDFYINQIGIATTLYTLAFEKHQNILIPFSLQITVPDQNIRREIENTGQLPITGQH